MTFWLKIFSLLATLREPGKKNGEGNFFYGNSEDVNVYLAMRSELLKIAKTTNSCLQSMEASNFTMRHVTKFAVRI